MDVQPVAHKGPCQENEQVLILLIKDVVSTLSIPCSGCSAMGL